MLPYQKPYEAREASFTGLDLLDGNIINVGQIDLDIIMAADEDIKIGTANYNGAIFIDDSTGRVGFGTLFPTKPWTFYRDMAGDADVYIRNPTGSAYIYIHCAGTWGGFVVNVGGQQWNAGMRGGDDWYFRDASHGKNPFIIEDNGANNTLYLASTGRIGVGLTNPAGKLHVDQSSATAAIPVLILDQADVSEEMIEFVSTIGIGNAIEAVGGKTLTVTHFIKVTLPGALTRYFPVGTIA